MGITLGPTSKDKLYKYFGQHFDICVGESVDEIYNMGSGMPSRLFTLFKERSGAQSSHSSEGGISKPYDQMFGRERGREIGEWLHLRFIWDRKTKTCKGMTFHPNMNWGVELTKGEIETIYFWAQKLVDIMRQFDKKLEKGWD